MPAAERRLTIALLEDAIEFYHEHFLGQSKKGRSIFRETEEWIFTSDDESPLSFQNVCAAIGLNPSYIRAGLVRRGKNASLAQTRGASPLTSLSQMETPSHRVTDQNRGLRNLMVD